MDLTSQTDSGQAEKPDNAGAALPSIDDAINSAMGGESTKPEPEAKASEPSTSARPERDAKDDADVAGDKSDREDANAPETPTDAKEPAKADAPQASKPLDAPQHWPADRKQAFQGLTDEGKRAMLALARDLEGGFTRKSQELGDKARFADSVQQLFSPELRQQLAQQGANEVGFIQYLTRLQAFSAHDPVSYVRYAMQNLGVRPEQLFPQAQPQQPVQPQSDIDDLLADPAVKDLKAQLSEIQKWKSEREKSEAEWVQRQAEARRKQEHENRQVVVRTIGDFRSAIDDHGQLKYPHFDRVSKQMGALMDTDPEISVMPDGPEKLAAAYDRAVWAVPALRDASLEAAKAAAVADAQKRADAARAKAVTAVKPSSGVPALRARTSSLDDAITDAFGRAGL